MSGGKDFAAKCSSISSRLIFFLACLFVVFFVCCFVLFFARNRINLSEMIQLVHNFISIFQCVEILQSCCNVSIHRMYITLVTFRIFDGYSCIFLNASSPGWYLCKKVQIDSPRICLADWITFLVHFNAITNAMHCNVKKTRICCILIFSHYSRYYQSWSMPWYIIQKSYLLAEIWTMQKIFCPISRGEKWQNLLVGGHLFHHDTYNHHYHDIIND